MRGLAAQESKVLMQARLVFGCRAHGRDECWDQVISPFEHHLDIAICLFDAAAKGCDAVEYDDDPREQPQGTEYQRADAMHKPFAGV